MIIIYHQIKSPINFLCKWRLNPKYFLQVSKILPVKLTKIGEIFELEYFGQKIQKTIFHRMLIIVIHAK